MEKFKKIANFLWYGVKIFLHLTDKKDKIDKMNNIEKDIKR